MYVHIYVYIYYYDKSFILLTRKFIWIFPNILQKKTGQTFLTNPYMKFYSKNHKRNNVQEVFLLLLWTINILIYLCMCVNVCFSNLTTFMPLKSSRTQYKASKWKRKINFNGEVIMHSIITKFQNNFHRHKHTLIENKSK